MQQACPSWNYQVQVGATTTVSVPVGGASSGTIWATCIGYPKLAFFFRSDIVVSLIIRTALDLAGGTTMTWLTLVGTASGMMTAYDLVSPIGDNGHVVVPFPAIQLQINNATLGATTFMRLYAYLYN